MAEEKDPAVASPIVQADFSVLAVDREVGRCVADMKCHLAYPFAVDDHSDSTSTFIGKIHIFTCCN